MSRKDFIAIADMLGRSMAGKVSELNSRSIAEGFAFRLRLTNPRFDPNRFVAAVLSARRDEKEQ